MIDCFRPRLPGPHRGVRSCFEAKPEGQGVSLFSTQCRGIDNECPLNAPHRRGAMGGPYRGRSWLPRVLVLPPVPRAGVYPVPDLYRGRVCGRCASSPCFGTSWPADETTASSYCSSTGRTGFRPAVVSNIPEREWAPYDSGSLRGGVRKGGKGGRVKGRSRRSQK